MKNFLLGGLGFLGLSAIAATLLLQAGGIDVAADTPHSPTVYRLIAWAREQSIARRAANIVPPPDLSDPGRIRRGAGNYDAMCANCHLSPGGEDSEIRKGLYPTPPNLSKPSAEVDAQRLDGRRFWIVKHGIKATGMPAWSKGGMSDEDIWNLTAFLKVLPSLSQEAYRRQVEASDGHSHGGIDGPRTDKKSTAAAEHRHDEKAHSHTNGNHKH